MTQWAQALFSRTPSTDHRWLALPKDIVDNPADRERAVGLRSCIPHRGADRPRMWIVRSDGKHVWFGTYGEVSRIFGEMRNGVRISRGGSDPADHRENLAFAGWVAKRSDDFSGLPSFSTQDAHPAFVQGHTDHLLDLWGEKGREVGGHSPIISTAYNTNLPLAGGQLNLPEGWNLQLRKAEDRIRKGHSFQLNCFEGRQADFVEVGKDGLPSSSVSGSSAERHMSSDRTLDHLSSSERGLYELEEGAGRFRGGWWHELPTTGKVTIGVGAAVAAAVIVGALFHAFGRTLSGSERRSGLPDTQGISNMDYAGPLTKPSAFSSRSS